MKDEFIQRNNDGSVFPKGVHFTPVPSPLLGPMLKHISSYNELVCLLRFLNLIHLEKKHPKWIEQNLLLSDEVLQSVIGSTSAILYALDKCVENGIILRTSLSKNEETQVLVLNTFDSKSNIDRIIHDGAETTLEVIENKNQIENIFSLYENNIGTLNPLITEELKYAQDQYSEEWIKDAFREAVVNNARSWRYIQSILKNWGTNGRTQSDNPDRRKSGRNRRHIKEIGQSTSKRY
tara:strand:- start:1628 stop:2335 length:708 start_codon:yes stop_codon:yes gene_type:complete